MNISRLFFGFIAAFCAFSATASELKTYPSPDAEKVISSYSVYVDGKSLDIYKAMSPNFEGGEYYFTYFDFSGEVDVRITSQKSCASAEVFPDIFNAKKVGNEISFKADRPFNLALLRNEREMPLLIFGNSIESDAPKPDDANVKYFGAGLHVLDSIELKDNQTLYIAGGAVVKASVEARGKNIRVRGRGILSFDHRERLVGNAVNFTDCKDLNIEGIILRGAMTWTLVLRRCRDVNIDGIKICGSRMINDDAIDICNSSGVYIKDCFIRAQDDIIAVKGMYMSDDGKFVYKRSMAAQSVDASFACEDISVENCVLWTDRANIFRIGYECWTPYMKNLRAKNIYVVYYGTPYRNPREVWSKAIVWLQPSEGMPISDMSFENIFVRSDGRDMPLVIVNPRVTDYLENSEPGSVENCRFSNIKVFGKKKDFRGEIFIEGARADRRVSNVSFENIEYFGEKLKKDSAPFEIGKFTDAISVK